MEFLIIFNILLFLYINISFEVLLALLAGAAIYFFVIPFLPKPFCDNDAENTGNDGPPVDYTDPPTTISEPSH